MKQVISVSFALILMLMAPFSMADAQNPKVLGVLFYADWCGSCRILDPKIEKARGKADLDNQDILFVRLDLTDATSRHQAELLASKLGLGEVYSENAGKTGFMVLFDGSSGKPIARLTKDMDADQIITAIDSALGS